MSETDTANEPAAPRDGEGLPLEPLRAYLSSELGGSGEEFSVAQFRGGHSNLTYQVRWESETFVLRRPPAGARSGTAHDMPREYRVLRALHPVFSRAPEPVALCEDEAVLGAPFFLMRQIPGLVIRREWPASLDASPAMLRRVQESLIDTLAELHRIDISSASMATLGKPDGYVERQVAGWTKRWVASGGDVATQGDVIPWLASHLPKDQQRAMLHNDYKLDNVVLDEADPSRLVGVLDWEMATLGDPRMDLGTLLSYWVEPNDPSWMKKLAFGPTVLPGSLTRREVVARYLAASDRAEPDMVFFVAFGLFKTATILQQIFARYQSGATKDPRFASLGDGAAALARAAARVIETGEY